LTHTKRSPKILLFDEETAPSLGHYFDLWKEGNIVWTVTDWYMLSVAYKWLGDSKVHCLALPDFKGYKPGSEDDSQLIKALWKLFDEADILIAHNGDQFDIKKANARFAYYNLPPPSPYKTVDTLKIARRYFNFTSNKLDELGNYLGYGRKLVHTGFHLWRGCMAGDPEAWKKMIAYNKRDVVLLEQIYRHFLPWITNHPNTAIMSDLPEGCPNCASPHLKKEGLSYTKAGKRQQYSCKDCHAWSSGPLQKLTTKGVYAR
jgi:DNA polymerase elongation subunit (family B)